MRIPPHAQPPLPPRAWLVVYKISWEVATWLSIVLLCAVVLPIPALAVRLLAPHLSDYQHHCAPRRAGGRQSHPQARWRSLRWRNQLTRWKASNCVR